MKPTEIDEMKGVVAEDQPEYEALRYSYARQPNRVMGWGFVLISLIAPVAEYLIFHRLPDLTFVILSLSFFLVGSRVIWVNRAKR